MRALLLLLLPLLATVARAADGLPALELQALGGDLEGLDEVLVGIVEDPDRVEEEREWALALRGYVASMEGDGAAAQQHAEGVLDRCPVDSGGACGTARAWAWITIGALAHAQATDMEPALARAATAVSHPETSAAATYAAMLGHGMGLVSQGAVEDGALAMQEAAHAAAAFAQGDVKWLATARVHDQRGQVLARLGRVDDAVEARELSAAAASNVDSSEGASLQLAAESALAELHLGARRYSDAEAASLRALKTIEGRSDALPDHLAVERAVACRRVLVDALRGQERSRDALAALDDLDTAVAALSEPFRTPLTVDALVARAELLHETDSPAAAEFALARAGTAADRGVGDERWRLWGFIDIARGDLAVQRGDLPAATAAYNAAVERGWRIVDPGVRARMQGWALLARGKVHEDALRAAEALEDYAKVIEIAGQIPDPGSRAAMVGQAHYRSGLRLMLLGAGTDALVSQRAAIVASELVRPPSVGTALRVRAAAAAAESLRRLGRVDEALELVVEVLEVASDPALGEEGQLAVAEAHLVAAWAHRASGRPAEALAEADAVGDVVDDGAFGAPLAASATLEGLLARQVLGRRDVRAEQDFVGTDETGLLAALWLAAGAEAVDPASRRSLRALDQAVATWVAHCQVAGAAFRDDCATRLEQVVATRLADPALSPDRALALVLAVEAVRRPSVPPDACVAAADAASARRQRMLDGAFACEGRDLPADPVVATLALRPEPGEVVLPSVREARKARRTLDVPVVRFVALGPTLRALVLDKRAVRSVEIGAIEPFVEQLRAALSEGDPDQAMETVAHQLLGMLELEAEGDVVIVRDGPLGPVPLHHVSDGVLYAPSVTALLGESAEASGGEVLAVAGGGSEATLRAGVRAGWLIVDGEVIRSFSDATWNPAPLAPVTADLPIGPATLPSASQGLSFSPSDETDALADDLLTVAELGAIDLSGVDVVVVPGAVGADAALVRALLAAGTRAVVVGCDGQACDRFIDNALAMGVLQAWAVARAETETRTAIEVIGGRELLE